MGLEPDHRRLREHLHGGEEKKQSLAASEGTHPFALWRQVGWWWQGELLFLVPMSLLTEEDTVLLWVLSMKQSQPRWSEIYYRFSWMHILAKLALN